MKKKIINIFQTLNCFKKKLEEGIKSNKKKLWFTNYKRNKKYSKKMIKGAMITIYA